MDRRRERSRLFMIPRLRLPITFNGASFDVVEQDSPEDVTQCALSVIATPEGSRVELPDFGIPEFRFAAGGVDESELVAAINEWEPRVANVFTEAQWDGLAETVRITVSA